MIVVYFLLAITATTLGSMAGLGGGVIIKPVLDVIGRDSITTISVLSSATVFTMAVVSMIKQLSAGYRFDKRMLILAIGAAGGGLLGGRIFTVIAGSADPAYLKGWQAVIQSALMILVIIRKQLPDWEIKNLPVSMLVGVLLGMIAAFLGVGGGPINVVVLCLFLAMSVKDAAVVSILIILFSQGAKLLLIQLDTGFGVYENLSGLYFMLPGAVAGGLLGARLNRGLSEEYIDKFFTILISGVLLLNLYNALDSFILRG